MQWDMWGLSSSTRDQTHDPWTGNTKSYPLDCLGSTLIGIQNQAHCLLRETDKIVVPCDKDCTHSVKRMQKQRKGKAQEKSPRPQLGDAESEEKLLRGKDAWAEFFFFFFFLGSRQLRFYLRKKM